MKILLTGAQGQLGYELRRTLAPLGQVIALDRAAVNLADSTSISKIVRDTRPTLIVNAGAYTAVDEAESEPQLAMAVNGTAPGILAEEAKRIGASIVHYSTDYVFDGAKETAYVEDDAPNPLSVYGHTKLAGERAVACAGAPFVIFRTSWIYGLRGHNFMRTIERLAAQRDELRIVSDQRGAPTWSRLVAEATALALARTRGVLVDVSGLYHLSCDGSTSWYEFAKRILECLQRRDGRSVPVVRPIDASSYPALARRPKNSALSSARALQSLGVNLPPWEEALSLCLENGSSQEI